MTVHVRVLNGPFFDIAVAAADTVGSVRARIGAEGGILMEEKRVSFEGRQMDQDERLVVSYGVTEGSTLVVAGP